MYAISARGYRAIGSDTELAVGETRSESIPLSLLKVVSSEQAKSERSELLRATDWTQMPDAPLTALEKAAYQTYRQALRDLPSLPGFPDVPWPTLPTIRDGTASSGEGAVYP